jgi:hypothetical protein
MEKQVSENIKFMSFNLQKQNGITFTIFRKTISKLKFSCIESKFNFCIEKKIYWTIFAKKWNSTIILLLSRRNQL